MRLLIVLILTVLLQACMETRYTVTECKIQITSKGVIVSDNGKPKMLPRDTTLTGYIVKPVRTVKPKR